MVPFPIVYSSWEISWELSVYSQFRTLKNIRKVRHLVSLPYCIYCILKIPKTPVTLVESIVYLKFWAYFSSYHFFVLQSLEFHCNYQQSGRIFLRIAIFNFIIDAFLYSAFYFWPFGISVRCEVLFRRSLAFSCNICVLKKRKLGVLCDPLSQSLGLIALAALKPFDSMWRLIYIEQLSFWTSD